MQRTPRRRGAPQPVRQRLLELAHGRAVGQVPDRRISPAGGGASGVADERPHQLEPSGERRRAAEDRRAVVRSSWSPRSCFGRSGSGAGPGWPPGRRGGRAARGRTAAPAPAAGPGCRSCRRWRTRRRTPPCRGCRRSGSCACSRRRQADAACAGRASARHEQEQPLDGGDQRLGVVRLQGERAGTGPCTAACGMSSGPWARSAWNAEPPSSVRSWVPERTWSTTATLSSSTPRNDGRALSATRLTTTQHGDARHLRERAEHVARGPAGRKR